MCSFNAMTVCLFVGIVSAQGGGRESHMFSHCPNGSVRHDNSCYYFSHVQANWPDSLVYCQAFGAHLVYIEDEREQNFVAAHAKLLIGSDGEVGHYYWMGGTDAVSEGEWYWHTIVEPLSYSHWSPNNPDNAGHQDCLALYSTSGQWDDGWCHTEHNFICEIELDEGMGSLIG